MRKILVACLLGLFGAGLAEANLTAVPVIMEFAPEGSDRQDITVGNVSNRVQYLEVSAQHILNPGEGPEEYFESPNPEEVGLLVAPRRVVLQPGEEKVVRVILLDQDLETDKAWRVYFKPVIGDIETDKSVAVTLVAIKALVMARPDNAYSEVTGTRDGKTLTLTNHGNSNVVLFEGQQCPDTADECISVTGKRLWPGKPWTTELPEDAPVTFKLRDTGDERSVTF